MKRAVKLVMAALLTAAIFSMTAFAAGWTTGQGENSGRWQYELDDGSFHAGTESGPSWQWLDGNQDGVAECYAFDSEGWMYADTETPDGYEVNGDGAWMEEGVVQARSTGTDTADTIDTADSNILIVYYSRTNTTEQAAGMIRQQVGGDLFEIQPADPYPSSYSATTERAQREINAGTLPELQANVENFDQYDTVFIGYPIWWGTTPPVVNTFMDSNDFNGKTVVPFCTSGGSGISGSLSNISQYCTGATILRGMDLTGSGFDSISSWLSNIGIIQ